ncbi:glycosyltransferase family 2 protein [Spirosoma foliorum]|uniref:Glycosyltransferase n=1 Tax=Spirosoma foliorum TaxID=2710596 RepID=A0A7G5GSK5_9BACT|nr:glycosyltransferase family 2 protein [Spirosoma foliorum]QMW01847.1 glycosyltransferase [Spirosoma foliorum]
MGRPLVSIITVVYNALPTLEATIQSVIGQDKELTEYWIIDGGSTDGSIDLIRKYEDQLAGWCSEPDKGIYDAMNKGINRATGDWLYFIGGDDTLRPNIIRTIEPYLKADYSIVFGEIMFDNGHLYRSFLGPRTILQNTVHHQSAFYNSSLFKHYRYDDTIKIVSEYDLHLRVYTKNKLTYYMPLIIADCATGGASSELSRSLKETNQVRTRYVKNKLKNNFLSMFLNLYYMQKAIRYFLYGHRV